MIEHYFNMSQLIFSQIEVGNIIWLLMILFIFFLWPRLMIAQAMMRFESLANKIELMVRRAKFLILRKISKSPGENIKRNLNHFIEFFVIEPVSLDPFGIIKKLEHLMLLSEKRFKEFVKRIAPKLDEEERSNLAMGISGAIALNQIFKLVRHFLETIKKTRNWQLSLIFQMQLPIIERISKALLEGTEGLIKGWPLGDSIAPLVAAKLIGSSKVKNFGDDIVYAEKNIEGRRVIIMKAKGPGGRLGKIGKASEALIKKYNINKILTVDAALKLEGEVTGSIAEGIGVAIGGIGVDKAYIENIATSKNIQLYSIIIKMSQEEAIQPMKVSILNSAERVYDLVVNFIKESSRSDKILIIGVGNTAGIGNNENDYKKAVKKIRKVAEIMKKREEKEKKKKKWYEKLGFQY